MFRKVTIRGIVALAVAGLMAAIVYGVLHHRKPIHSDAASQSPIEKGTVWVDIGGVTGETIRYEITDKALAAIREGLNNKNGSPGVVIGSGDKRYEMGNTPVTDVRCTRGVKVQWWDSEKGVVIGDALWSQTDDVTLGNLDVMSRIAIPVSGFARPSGWSERMEVCVSVEYQRHYTSSVGEHMMMIHHSTTLLPDSRFKELQRLADLR